MEYYAEIRLRGDEYNDGYGNGMTLSGSETTRGEVLLSSSESESVFETKKGHRITVLHEKTKDVTIVQTVFENCTKEDAVVELLSSFAIRGITADRMHRATSFWSAEGKLLSQDLIDLNMERSWANHGFRIEKFGQNGSMPVRKYFPFLILEDSKTQHFLGVQLYLASSWQIEVLRNRDEITIHGGIPDRDYGQWYKTIHPDESFTTPKAVIAEGDSILDVCDKLVKAQSPRIAEVDQDLPVIFNEYCTTWGSPSYENLEKIAKKLDGTGVRYLVIDCGWYKGTEDENWFVTAGDWKPSQVLFPKGIRQATDMIRSHGLIPGIWFEFENCGKESEAFQKTDMLQKRDGFPVTVGTRRFLDMRKKEAWEYLDEKMLKLLKENGFGYLKVDYNENMGAGVDGDESYGEGVRQSVLKSQEYFRHLAEEMPELVIENCASGGHRLEPSMMELVSQASFSDAHECTTIPLIAANLHRVIRPEQSQIWAVLREKDDADRLYYTLTAAFLGRLCLSGDIFALSDEQWNIALAAIPFYMKISGIIRDGKTVAIETNANDYTKPTGYQIVRRVLGNEELLIVHTFEGGNNPPVERFLEGKTVLDSFGSSLEKDFQGKAYLLSSRA
ncbi:MAG: alpha-galactosidase [Clostridiales bacterium]|nr:alpha-galactosidase [Clostridiales bacterium]